MIQKMYLFFGNKIFRHLVTPDNFDPAYYLNTNIWTPKRFSDLFFTMLIASLIVAIIYHLFFNGKSMPAVYNKKKHWFYTMLIGFVLNIIIVAVFFSMSNFQFNNHFYCTAMASAFYGVIAFIIFSIGTKYFSTSAKNIPF